MSDMAENDSEREEKTGNLQHNKIMDSRYRRDEGWVLFTLTRNRMKSSLRVANPW